MNFGEQLDNIKKTSNKSLYQNFDYQTERIEKKNLIIDTAYCFSNNPAWGYSPDEKLPPSAYIQDGDKFKDNFDPKNKNYYKTWTDKNVYFNTTLINPLIINKRSEIYIDTVFMYNIKDEAHPILIDFKTFNKTSSSNNPFISDKYVLAREPLSQTNYNFKSKKMNYLTTINPQTINKIEFTIENADETLDESNGNYKGIFKAGEPKKFGGRAIIELVIVSLE